MYLFCFYILSCFHKLDRPLKKLQGNCDISFPFLIQLWANILRMQSEIACSSDAFTTSFQGGITQLLCKQESEHCVDQLGEQLEMRETTLNNNNKIYS